MKKYHPFIKEMVFEPIKIWFIWILGFIGTIDTVISHLDLADSLSNLQKGLFVMIVDTFWIRFLIYIIVALAIVIWVVLENSFRIWSKYNSQVEVEKIFLTPKFDYDKREMWLIVQNAENFKITNCKATLVFASLYNKHMDRLNEPLIENQRLIWHNSNSDTIELTDVPERLNILVSNENLFCFQTIDGKKLADDGLYSVQIKITGIVNGQDIKSIVFYGYVLFKLKTVFTGIILKNGNDEIILDQAPRIGINYIMGFCEGNYRKYVEEQKLIENGLFNI